MKNYRLKTVNANGEVVEISSLQMKERSVLIQHLPEGMNAEIAHKCHRNLSESLNNNNEVITILNGIQLEVLEVE